MQNDTSYSRVFVGTHFDNSVPDSRHIIADVARTQLKERRAPSFRVSAGGVVKQVFNLYGVHELRDHVRHNRVRRVDAPLRTTVLSTLRSIVCYPTHDAS